MSEVRVDSAGIAIISGGLQAASSNFGNQALGATDDRTTIQANPDTHVAFQNALQGYVLLSDALDASSTQIRNLMSGFTSVDVHEGARFAVTN